MPKTGSSSIQETLFYGLRDPGFVYCSFGEINGGYPLDALVGRENHIGTSRSTGLGLSTGRYRQRLMRRLQRSIRTARTQDANLIISSEFCYLWSADQHHSWRRIASDNGLTIRIIAYLRPPLDWLAAKIGQSLKYGRITSHEQLLQTYASEQIIDLLSFGSRLRRLEQIYGSGVVTVRPFIAERLSNGCVVEDFCKTLNIHLEPGRIRRQNESLSLPASQCLHRLNIAMHRPLSGPVALLRRDALLNRLKTIFRNQPGLRLSPLFLGETQAHVDAQLAIVEQDYGIDLPLTTATDPSSGLSNLEALLQLSPAANSQLRQATGASPDDELATIVRGLEPDWPLGTALAIGARLLRRELRQRISGC
ncbi:MAG: hypothetical protein VKO65_01295 [Cyanobacteriota bacterium]|nr:hypothetical protein [Cyanobacteriota bacterium]